MQVLLPTCLGALGGALNAYLCFSKIPVEVAPFQWHIIAAGAFHGGILFLTTWVFSALFYPKDLFLRILGVFPTGYLAGGLSWVPIRSSIDERFTVETLWWIDREGVWDALLGPFQTFGLVAVALYFYFAIVRQLWHTRWELHLMACCLSGIAGSLWFWAAFDHWYLSFLHGLIWGLLVGWGVWFSNCKHRVSPVD